MPYVDETRVSCGVSSLSFLDRDPVVNVLTLARSSGAERFVVFSDIAFPKRETPGMRLARFIKEHPKLGKIRAETNRAKNPNSGNPIKVWIWEPNRNLRSLKPSMLKEYMGIPPEQELPNLDESEWDEEY